MLNFRDGSAQRTKIKVRVSNGPRRLLASQARRGKPAVADDEESDGITPAGTASAATGGRPVSAESSDTGHPARWWIMAVLAAVAFMAQLDLFIVNVALPTIGASYHGASLSGLSWVLNAYAIIFAALLVPAGRLADHFGRRRFLLIGVLVFTLASAACAAAPTLGVLVAARAVQAVGAALIVPDLARACSTRRSPGGSTRWWSGSGPGSPRSPPPPGRRSADCWSASTGAGSSSSTCRSGWPR